MLDAFHIVSANLPLLGKALLVTIELNVASIVLAMVLGTIMGIDRSFIWPLETLGGSDRWFMGRREPVMGFDRSFKGQHEPIMSFTGSFSGSHERIIPLEG